MRDRTELFMAGIPVNFQVGVSLNKTNGRRIVAGDALGTYLFCITFSPNVRFLPGQNGVNKKQNVKTCERMGEQTQG
jgi:hypothetical protein